MAKPTREQVVERAYTIISYLGYYWGGWPGQRNITRVYWNRNTDSIETDSSGNLIGCDCSGFTSWCWCLGSKRGSWSWYSTGEFGGSNFHSPTAGSSARPIEEKFPGILPGDVMWREGHVGLYIGNNQTLEANSKWVVSKSTYLNGCNLRTNSNFDGYCSYSESFAGEYDPDEDDVLIKNFSNGEVGPPPNPDFPGGIPGDISDPNLEWIYNNFSYTKRYSLMKLYRRF